MDNPLQRAIEIAGGQTALAQRIGKTQGHISKWLERDFIPPDVVLSIESATGIPRYELRPDLYPAEEFGLAEIAGPVTSKQLMGKHWTVAELDAMERAGLFAGSDRFELIAGEIVPMSAKGAKHEHYKGSLLKFWMQNMKEGYNFIPETTFRLSKDTYLEPDFVFYDSKYKIPQLAASNTLLAVEVSDTTLKFDRGRKASIYASFGVPVLWVLDVKTLETHVFEQPGIDGYKSTQLVGPNEVLVPGFAPELAVKLSELVLI